MKSFAVPSECMKIETFSYSEHIVMKPDNTKSTMFVIYFHCDVKAENVKKNVPFTKTVPLVCFHPYKGYQHGENPQK